MYKINEKPIISPDLLLSELFEAYPEIIECITSLLPAYNIRYNEKLFETVTKVTSVRQAAIVGKMELPELISKLRKITGEDFDSTNFSSFNPENYSVYVDYNAIKDLQTGLHPVGKVISEIKDLPKNSVYILTTPFIPSPLIDMVQKQGFSTHIINEDSIVKTYIYK